ncbi:MAG: TetR family transcriptional regulator [Microbacterium sp.]|uniref:DNA-binding transcriptional repressor AcrR n=1 Tax=Microbacterium ginsengisoli TaxID=400772 RepID=A0A0F0LQ37_9MICO|nr:TetR/AcrR family transcriptional regulator [Microbacterium ginsengisoli]KJL35327.1 DNA-binding transcriptional repressor AcrR [Microbacterium ginsengisoli]MAL05883.1 TetR family transcriptional regulator [Microbacterium sp.]MBN9208614.1 TetR family transcriptional regulator [Microbacterium ginsengisoli]HAN23833.1 TetR family transcriptional regulator [Microbacterium ginsengisoli]
MASGRPRATSRETISDAACELFLEQGYDATSVADITVRAGVSRSSFFNYFDSKAEVLWSGLDERLTTAAQRLDAGEGDGDAAVRAALVAIADGFAPDALALALVHAEAMGVAGELDRDAATRQARLGRAIARRLAAGGQSRLVAEVRAAAYAGALFAALRAWAHAGPGTSALSAPLAAALAAVDGTPLA